ncbi:MAG: DUF4823 domain-containing protein [Vibrio fluvialis]
MNLIKLFAFVSSAALLGCADSHSLNVTDANSNIKLMPDTAVYISLSKDGEYGEHYYSGSGQMVSQIIQGELVTRLNNVVIAQKPESYASALQFASERKFDYLVYPTILHWEDRSTEWSAKPDKVKVKISVIDVKQKSTIKAGIIDGKSGLATFGGDKPQDLLPEPTKEFFSDLL